MSVGRSVGRNAERGIHGLLQMQRRERNSLVGALARAHTDQKSEKKQMFHEPLTVSITPYLHGNPSRYL